MRKLPLRFFVLALWLHSGNIPAAQSQASHYIGLYGLAESHQNNERVMKIFSGLARISDRDILGTELVIVTDQNPWAKALDDDNIVMSSAAIDLIYSHADVDASDAWLAFILGHELAHITNADLWHRSQQVRRSDSSDPLLDSVYEEIFSSGHNINHTRDRELKADLDGFFYATLAGYNTALLFDPVEGGKTLLERWPDRNSDNGTHRSGTVRMKFLEEEFDRLQKDVAFFESGLKLAHFGKYEDALLLFRKFQTQYPSAEVMNNLAYLYIQLARKNMPAHLAYRYWFPALLEVNSGLPSYATPRTYGDSFSPQVTGYLKKAVSLLTRTPGQKKGLPQYLNLIVAYWYLDETSKARAVIDEALVQFPANEQLSSMGAMVIFRHGKPDADTWADAKNILETLIANGNTDNNIRFNLARLLSDRRRYGEAKKHWAHLVAHADSVATPFLAIACVMLNGDHDCVSKRTGLPAVPITVSIGSDIGEPAIKKILGAWSRTSELIQGVQVDLYQHETGDSIIALDNVVEIYTLGNSPWHTRDKLAAVTGLPDNVTQMMNGSLLSFTDDWSALIKGDLVSELWVIRDSEIRR